MTISENYFGKFLLCSVFLLALLAAQVNRKIESDIKFSGCRDQVTSGVYSRNQGYICVKVMARHLVFVFDSLVFFLSSVIMFDKRCANSTQRSQLPKSLG